MVKKAIIVILLAFVAWGLYLYLQSDERKVRKRFSKLSELVSKEGGESAVVLAQKARNTGALFYSTCTIESGDSMRSGTYKPEEIASHTASARAMFQELSLEFYDLKVDFPSGDTARAGLTGILKGLTKSDELFDETHELEVDLTKVENDWFISRIKAVQTLER